MEALLMGQQFLPVYSTFHTPPRAQYAFTTALCADHSLPAPATPTIYMIQKGAVGK